MQHAVDPKRRLRVIRAVHFMSPSPNEPPGGPPRQSDALLVLLPLLVVLSTFLFLLLLFLVCVLLIRRRRAIVLRDHDGPVDMSHEEFIEGDGSFSVIEQRWLDSVTEPIARAYNRANGSSPPSSPPPYSPAFRVPAPIPPQFSSNGYNSFSISFDSGERRFCLVF